jgi:2-iminoacetate synthase ThiH
MKHEFIKDVHYYLDGDKVIFTEAYHIQRGECCGNKCRHCPFTKPVKKGNTEVEKKRLVFRFSPWCFYTGAFYFCPN